ncbi:hypothetical protein Pan181_50560 [Aeoliella mucimassa]|uniref:DUF1553 domain-containing protein n=1 Tax=Aeoliella mucimassa TaxID=2527972 RepID=A0A518AVR7_9BACT|nr:hypothetical protein Pan181_50560 [Aeoliella mucimassa]
MGIAPAAAASLFETSGPTTTANDIDQAVRRRLNRLKLAAAPPCSDAVFLRRAFLDLIGTLPTADEARQFLNWNKANKRIALVNQLLSREEFVQYWGMKWCDLLRVKAEFPINLWPNAAQAYDRWIRESVRENKPYDHMVRELLTSSGSNFRVGPVNFYRAMQSNTPRDIASTVALTFMGERVDRWPAERLDGLAVFFSCVGFKGTREWKEEVVYFDSVKAVDEQANGNLAKAVFPDGTPASLDGQVDPREVFADWLICRENASFARCAANRIWFWLFGRGIVHEPDDFRSDNPASCPELLNTLEKKLIASKYDCRELIRFIVSSQTYQQSPVPRSDSQQADTQFACYPLRRLEAEVLIDAICGITDSTESYSSAIPEPFTFIPEQQRSIELPDGSITSSFLEMFGRPPRDTGMANERNNQPTSAQRLHMLNSSHIRRKIERSESMKTLIAKFQKNPVQGAAEIYLTVLSRYPTDVELAVVEQYAKGSIGKRRAAFDLVWALMNSSEFLYRH